MNGTTDWRDAKYEETFEQELLGLERRCSLDSSCTVEDIEGTLRHLYHMQGSDWVGRGELQDLILQATIAAHEAFIERLKAKR